MIIVMADKKRVLRASLQSERSAADRQEHRVCHRHQSVDEPGTL